ncbi:metal ABC transporter solute-binding protein, Zn/Mn family [Telmatospirillum sp. J64-1]|uniref:metal ABC transporter solute-binding protein, Zn/Mn family n=1 Tax=Telmatospirillum sp. J64-1 TaxID=2502183 RepID=UPI00115DC065|nr:zinc ABC transporter substrate-binding protein [Telmatospirillum sp. J64-1]
MNFRTAVLALSLFSLPAAAGAETVVLTGHPVTAGIATSLTLGTELKVETVVPPTIPMGRQLSYLTGRGQKALNEAAAKADSVLTLRATWEDDPLYALARRVNVRVIEVDASRPVDGALPGLARVALPQGGPLAARLGLEQEVGSAPFPWLAPTALGRMADIVAADLRRLYPDSAARLDDNLDKLKHDLLALSAKAAMTFAALPDPSVVSLSNRFAALTPELGLDVRSTVALDDRDWTPERLDILTAFLKEEAIPVVLHHREPAEAIAAAVAAGGAKLVVLDSLETGEPAQFASALGMMVERLAEGFETAENAQ